jgi:hypothetical protein
MSNGDGVVWVLGGAAILLIGGVYIISQLPKSGTSTGTTTPTPTGTGIDKFGLKQLYPSTGKEWISNWDNGHARTIQAKGIAAPWVADPDDPDSTIVAQDYAAHKNELVIDGKGSMIMSGENCRNYHKGPWQNVEMTAWYKKVKPFPAGISVILRLAARTEHQDQYKCPGSGHTMGSFELKGNGTVQLRKELAHTTPDAYADNIVATVKTPTESGVKFILRNVGTNAILSQAYMSDTKTGGGNWVKVLEKLDKGDWPFTDSAALGGFKNAKDGTGTCKKLPSPTSISLEPATSCYFRNDGNVTELSMASIREIAPLTSASASLAYETRPLYNARVTVS